MPKKNILYIMSDDHASNAISAYKSILSTVFETPNLDRIASEGCLLNNCYCENAICTPSRATILTGQYSHTNGVKTLDDHLDINSNTFIKMMQADGYDTAIFGKWHVHSKPQGFNTYKILPGQGLYFDPYFVSDKDEWDAVDGEYPTGTEYKGYVTDLVTDFTLDWLKNRESDAPFMLMCHHKAPHDNFEYHPRYEHIFDGVEIPEPGTLFEDKSHRSDGSREYGTTVSDKNLRRNAVKTMSQEDYVTGQLDVRGLDATGRTKAAYQKYLKDYMRTVKAVDDNVGRLLDYLDESGLAENTLVVYTSDQGMFLGEHDYIDKRWIYEEALKMPMMIRLPGVIPQGSSLDNLVSNVDFAPTFLELAGLKKTDEMQGRSFLDMLKGSKAENWDECIYNRYWMHMTHHDNPAHYGIRTDRYKIIYFYGLPLGSSGAIDYKTPIGWELYDLKVDPYETKNVYNEPEYADVVVNMKKRLKDMKDRIGDPDTKYPEMLLQPESLY